MYSKGGMTTMYAIAFDLDIERLKDTYHNTSWNNAYLDIRNYLQAKGFTPQQESVYFGDSGIDAVKTILAVQGLSRKYEWFSASVRDIQMLRIEENSNLMPAIVNIED